MCKKNICVMDHQKKFTPLFSFGVTGWQNAGHALWARVRESKIFVGSKRSLSRRSHLPKNMWVGSLLPCPPSSNATPRVITPAYHTFNLSIHVLPSHFHHDIKLTIHVNVCFLDALPKGHPPHTLPNRVYIHTMHTRPDIFTNVGAKPIQYDGHLFVCMRKPWTWKPNILSCPHAKPQSK